MPRGFFLDICCLIDLPVTVNIFDNREEAEKLRKIGYPLPTSACSQKQASVSKQRLMDAVVIQ